MGYFGFKVVKLDLLQLLKNGDYKTFQKKIGMPNKLKDYITKGRKILKAHFYHSYGYMN